MTGRFWTFMSGMGVGLMMAFGCASTPSFPWPWYGIHLPDREITQDDLGKDLGKLCYLEGKLLGKIGQDGWPDRQLTECEPDPVPSQVGPSPAPSPILLKCGTFKIDDVYSIKADDEKCHADLIACQHGPSPINPQDR